jgi:hypothetical protein
MEEKNKNALDDFEKKCQEIHADREKEREKGTIYHYTTYEGIKSILETRKLRYTDYRYINDPTEIKYGQEIVIEALLESDIVYKYHLTKNIKNFFNNFDFQMSIYVSCFSKTRDKLAIWRYYASNGTGFAIGFNNFPTADHLNIKPKPVRIITEVMYGKEEPKEFLKKFIEEYLKVFEEALNRLKEANKNQFCSFLVELDARLMAQFISLLPSLKDDSFKDENEVRIFYPEGELIGYYIDDRYREFIPIPKNRTPFVHSLQGNKPVVSPHQFDHTDISEIWVGPCCEFSEARNWLRQLLSDNGYRLNEVKIALANFPYKNS